MTLVELSIAMMITTLVAGTVAATVTSSLSLSRANREQGMAMDAALEVLQTMRAMPLAEVFPTYDVPTGNDPVAGAPGPSFDVDGLRARDDDGDGRVGEVIFPGGGTELLENVQDRDLGMPRDLNGDGAQDGADHGADYRMLPVRVRVSWRGSKGNQTVELVAVLTED